MKYEVIIIGGSYSGLSAGMSLGRASRNVLIIDAGEPCNRQTPHSHNFITHDGDTPAEISAKAKEQVLLYPTISFVNDKAIKAIKMADGFEISTESGKSYSAKKLLLATGVKDIMPNIEGFAQCWGISIIHCPYCHGYEVKNQKTALMANSDIAIHMVPMLLQWTKDLVVFTNGMGSFTDEQLGKFKQHNVSVIETEMDRVIQTNGKLEKIILKDGKQLDFSVMYAKIPAVQHTFIPEDLGCKINEMGLIEVDEFKKTNIDGVYASGDCTTPARALAMAIEAGVRAAITINNDLCLDAFENIHL